jgi:predicted flap endonuclease-1-like 5' DNA nuclease
MIKTVRGLPNTCSNCSREITEGFWYAEHEDGARSGQGRCSDCVGKGTTRAPIAGNGGAGDDLEAIDGIGPAIAKVLNDQGIITYLQLAEADSSDIAKLVKKPVDTVLEWQTEAASML